MQRDVNGAAGVTRIDFHAAASITFSPHHEAEIAQSEGVTGKNSSVTGCTARICWSMARKCRNR